MSLYFKYSDTFADGQQIGFGFKLHVISFGCPRETLTKGVPCSFYHHACPALISKCSPAVAVYEKMQCTFSSDSPGWGHQKMAEISKVSDPRNGDLVAAD